MIDRLEKHYHSVATPKTLIYLTYLLEGFDVVGQIPRTQNERSKVV